MTRLKQDASAARQGVKGIRELYPNQFVRSERSLVNKDANRTKKVETRGISCRQCNFPIKDRGIAICPNCESDNFEGRPVTL